MRHGDVANGTTANGNLGSPANSSRGFAFEPGISPTEALLSHTQMLTTRRRKQKTKKRLARIAKQQKKLSKQTVKAAGTEVVPTTGTTG